MDLLVIFFYILLFGGLSLVRQERLSNRFALEALVLGGGVLGASAAWNAPPSPVLLLVGLYLVTMRARWLTELANAVGRGGHYTISQTLYGLALSLWPDAISRQVVWLNRAAMWLKAGDTAAAQAALEALLAQGEPLSPKHEAAAHYNLGLAYERLEENQKAVRHFNTAIETLPGSLYAIGAEAALRRRRTKQSGGDQPDQRPRTD